MKKSTRPSRKRAFVVDRRKWGKGENGGKLLDKQTHLMCCLGFVSLQCKVPRKAIAGRGIPHQVVQSCHLRKFPTVFVTSQDEPGPISSDAVDINDSEDITDKMREYKLKRLFKKHGCSIRFTH